MRRSLAQTHFGIKNKTTTLLERPRVFVLGCWSENMPLNCINRSKRDDLIKISTVGLIDRYFEVDGDLGHLVS